MIYIYRLIDPITLETRYIGKTNNVKYRYSRHVKYEKSDCHKARWINSLKAKGCIPVIDIIETCCAENWEEREKYWIAEYKKNKSNLTNETIGGDGRQGGFKHSKESIEKISKALKNRTSEQRKIASEKSGITQNGRKLSKEHKLKLSEAHKKYYSSLSDEQKNEINKCLRHVQTEETKRKISKSRTGKKNGSNCSSKYPGVSLFKRDNKWRAYIMIGKKQKHLGYYSTPEEAHAAYCEASKKYHGEFGRTE